jgi:hypothetical protein
MTIEYLDSSRGFVGSGNAVARMLDPFTLQEPLTRVTPPSQEWQLFEAQRASKNGIDWYTVEGPTVFSHRKRYYEMFSGGCYYRDNYAISYATSNTPMGPHGLDDTSWQDWQGRTGEHVLVQGNVEHFLSPGHNSLVPGPNNVDSYLAYHVIQHEETFQRAACLDRLFLHGDDLWTPAPTYTTQLAPAMPRIHELFDSPYLSTSWQPQGGTWTVSSEEGEVTQENAALTIATLQHRETLHADWLLEVNLRHQNAEGTYGLLFLDHAEPVAQLELTWDGSLRLSDASSHEPLQLVPLPPSTVMQAWHQLLIARSGSLLTVYFDGQPLLETLLSQPVTTFALLTQRCNASFSSISLTDHFRDEFLHEQYTPTLLGWQEEPEAHKETLSRAASTWLVRHGAFVQMSDAQAEHSSYKEVFAERGEYSATMRQDHASGLEQAAFGLVLKSESRLYEKSYSTQEQEEFLLPNTEKMFICLKQEQSKHWTLTGESTETTHSPQAHYTFPLPETFRPSDWHTLRLEQREGELCVALDGPEVLTLPMPYTITHIGLFTKNTAAAFTSVWHTGKPAPA